MDRAEGLKNELMLKIAECNDLHETLKRRPFEWICDCDLVTYDDWKKHDDDIRNRITQGQEFYVNARKGDAVLTLRPFKFDETHFFGLVVGVSGGQTEVKVFDLVRFGAYSLYDYTPVYTFNLN